jgi:hypothetical protein
LAKASQTCTSLRCTGLSSVHRTMYDAQAGALSELAALGKIQGATTIIHRTVRCASRAPSQRSTAQSAGDTRVSQLSEGCTKLTGVPPDCPVCHKTSGWQRSASLEKERNRTLFNVRWCTRLSGAPTDRRQPVPSK